MKHGFVLVLAATACHGQPTPLVSDAALDAHGPGMDVPIGDAQDAASPDAASPVTAVSAGAERTCALHAGVAECWGNNASSLLAVGTSSTPVKTPLAVVGLPATTWLAISTGTAHACALGDDGTVACWGNNIRGALGDGDFVSPGPGSVGPLAGPVTAIATANGFSCARLAAKTVQCWGDNAAHQLASTTLAHSNVPVAISGLADVAVLAAGGARACVLLGSGDVECWGDGPATPTAINGLGPDVSALALGDFHACALLASGAVQCWGDNSMGQLGDGTTDPHTSPVTVSLSGAAVEIAAGGRSTCALLASGVVACWGDNTEGKLGGTTSAAISASPVTVTDLTASVDHVTVGDLHACVKLSTGGLECWGYNSSGELGIDTNVPAGKGAVVGFP
jgi:alpha-tubulin suppressor-like RCC1 family protein